MKAKKKLYIFLTIIVFITSSAFDKCNEAESNLFFNFFIGIVFGHGQVRSGDNTTLSTWGVMVGQNGKIFVSDNRPPAPWIEKQSGVSQDLNGVQAYPDSLFCFAVGNQGVVLCSPDKGQNWNTIRVPNSNYTDLNGVGIIPQSNPGGLMNIVTVGDLGTVLRSSNNGTNWSWINISINTTKKLNSVAITGGAVFVVVGDSGAIYRTLDAGITWENRSISSSVSLKKVTSPLFNRFCAAGTGGAIYVSNDYGYSWSLKSTGTTRTFRDIIFSSADSGVAAGEGGVVRHTTNGGANWLSDVNLNNLTTRNIISISRVDQNTVISITSNSIPGDNLADTSILFAVSSEPFSAIEPISNFIADLFSLKQNYPNPFNPETNIRFDVPADLKGQMSNVKITVYDIAGKEISVLVNEQLSPGEYEVKWNASDYPSGVYFYTILADDYKETRKMILLK